MDNVQDRVNHPKWYETGQYECIDVMTETQGKKLYKIFVYVMLLNIYIDIELKTI